MYLEIKVHKADILNKIQNWTQTSGIHLFLQIFTKWKDYFHEEKLWCENGVLDVTVWHNDDIKYKRKYMQKIYLALATRYEKTKCIWKYDPLNIGSNLSVRINIFSVINSMV